jgi:hypothetical protein
VSHEGDEGVGPYRDAGEGRIRGVNGGLGVEKALGAQNAVFGEHGLDIRRRLGVRRAELRQARVTLRREQFQRPVEMAADPPPALRIHSAHIRSLREIANGGVKGDITRP